MDSSWFSISICIVLPKVAKASTDACHCCWRYRVKHCQWKYSSRLQKPFRYLKMRGLAGVCDVNDPVSLFFFDPLTESCHVGRIVRVSAVGFDHRQRNLKRNTPEPINLSEAGESEN